MLKDLSIIYKHTNDEDVMEKLDAYAQQNSFEISVLLSLSYDRCVPTHILKHWLQTFHLLSKSMKIRSLQNIINGSEIIQKLFNSCTEYQACSHFIENDLIPMIIDYEMTDHDLIKEIIQLYQHKIDSHTHVIQTKMSFFNLFGWIELLLFSFLNISHILITLLPPLYSSIIQTLQLYTPPLLLLLFCIHLFLAINTFSKRRIFCYYLHSLSPQINNDQYKYKYTPYILEGFNIYDISLFRNNDYNQPLKLISPNEIDCYCILLLSLKYIIGIVYCLCVINYYLGIIAIFLFPIIIGVMSNLDNIFKRLYESTYQDIIAFYQHADHEYEQLNTDDTATCDIQQIHDKESKWRYFFRFNGYLCGYSLLMLCCWPILFLTPFVFGFSILCNIDPGLENKWTMRQFCRYWSAFMSVKVIIGMTIVSICELCCNWSRRLNRSNELNANNIDNDETINNNIANYDAYNSICYTAMNFVSIIVVILLIFGMDNIILQIFRIIVWFVVYIWLSTCSIKQIIPENQRVANWTSVFKVYKWINSNLLKTKF
eukprot:179207_1